MTLSHNARRIARSLCLAFIVLVASCAPPKIGTQGGTRMHGTAVRVG